MSSKKQLYRCNRKLNSHNYLIMAEKRKAELTILLRYNGKRKMNKVEFFHASLWDWKKPHGLKVGNKYRLRVNGKWFKKNKGDGKFFWKSEIRDLFWRSLKIK